MTVWCFFIAFCVTFFCKKRIRCADNVNSTKVVLPTILENGAFSLILIVRGLRGRKWFWESNECRLFLSYKPFMKTYVLTSIIIFLCLNKTNAQTNDTTDAFDKLANYFRYDTYEYALTQNDKWAKNSKTVTFENQGNSHSTYFAINNDSTFIFLSIYEPGEFLTTGKWTKPNDTTFTFNWDKNKTLAICKDKKIYHKYYKYSMPLPLKITDWTFIRRDSVLSPTSKRQ